MPVEHSVERLCDLVESLCGVALDTSKMYLIRGRLRHLLDEHGFKDYDALASDAQRPSKSKLRDELVDALTTNETLFFRDRSPFETIRTQILPKLREASKSRPRLRIWSAACSTGQEPYSIAMMLRESLHDLKSWDIQILATDVSPGALEKARSGRYAQHEIDRGIDDMLRRKYFQQKDDQWEICPEIKRMVHFELHNLHKIPPMSGPFDVILCRNVAIYFKPDARRDVFARLASRLTPEGYLLVGCSESLHDLGERFRPIRLGSATVYQPNLPVAAR